MAYTTIDQVKGHLISNYPLQDKVTDQAVTLTQDSMRFYPAPIEDASLRVKSKRSARHMRVVTTIQEGPVQISSSPIVPGSVVVASDSSFGITYEENVDFTLEFDSGRIKPKPGGRFVSGQIIVVWFIPYVVLERGDDYSCDAGEGTIRRLAGGTIASGETVYLDYVPLSSDLSEALLSAAVAEANSLVEREVDPQGEYGADAALSLAATYCALEIICRTSAARELSSLRSEDRVALAWMKLADSYHERSDSLMSSFRPKVSGPARPSRT